MGKKYNNLISTTAGFNYTAEQPLDDRDVVQSYSDLATLVSAHMSYEGMEVYVVDDQKSYKLIGTEWCAVATEDWVNSQLETIDGVGEETANGGEIFNDYTNNQALSEYSHAEGYNSCSGAKVFSFNEEYYANTANDFTADKIDGTSEGWYHLNSVEGLAEILIAEKPTYTVLLTNNYDFNGTIQEVDTTNKKIRVTNFLLPNEVNASTGELLAGQKLRTVADFGIDRSYVMLVDHTDVGDVITGDYTHTEGENTIAAARAAHAEGRDTKAVGKHSHTEGRGTTAAYCGHAEGNKSKALADSSHAEGSSTIATGVAAHAEGKGTEATQVATHAEGENSKATAYCAHAEGKETEASGAASHAEGFKAISSNDAAHAEGYETKATGAYSHAGGRESEANHIASISHGLGVKSSADYQANFGKYNALDPDALLTVGGGDDDANRYNALTVKKDGRVAVYKNPTDSMDVTTKEYVDSFVFDSANIKDGAVTKAKLAGDVKREFEYEETIATDITNTLTIINEAKLPQNGIVATGQENSQCTEPFAVVEGEKYLISGSYGFAFVLVGEYDASNNFIGYIGKSDEETVAVTDYEYTVPTGVSKIIVSNSSTFLTPNLKVKKIEPSTVKNKIAIVEEAIAKMEENSLKQFEVVNAFSMGSTSDWSVTGGSISIDGSTIHIDKADISVQLIELERLNIPLVEESGKKVFFYFEERAYPDLSYGFNGSIKFSVNGTKRITAGKVNRDYNAYYGVFDLTNDGASSQRVSFLVSASNMIGVENSYDIRNIFISDSIQGFDTDFTEKLYLSILSKNGFFEGAQPLISAEDYLNLLVSFEKDNATLTTEKTVTVGESGDFKTLNGALKHLSRYYPAYKQGGVNCQIKILSGTIISEQVTIQRIDLSYITIIAEDAQVPVDASKFTIVDSLNLDAHDLRGNVPFIGGENAAKLPVIGCLFKLTVQPINNSGVVGYFANRGSNGVVLADSGFDGFNDGVIANNESSITIRQGIARNCTRWGVHARHNGEVSARSCDLSNSGEIAAYADRVANLDAREANVNGSKMAFAAYNASILNGNMDSAIANCGNGAEAVVHATNGSTINICNTSFSNCKATIIKVASGGIVTANGISVSGSAEGIETYSQPVNTLTAQGVIFG